MPTKAGIYVLAFPHPDLDARLRGTTALTWPGPGYVRGMTITVGPICQVFWHLPCSSRLLEKLTVALRVSAMVRKETILCNLPGENMKFATGIFDSRSDAENALQRLRQAGFGAEQICMLSPQTNGAGQASCVQATDGEQPGMGKVIGGVVGGAIGASGGLPLGMAISSAFLPGVGPVLAAGFVTAALAGAAGAAGGAAAGGALEYSLTEGLPRDELYFYEDALEQGRSILIFRTEDDPQQETAKNIMRQAGAESIDAARQRWWIGLRDAEALHYDPNSDFSHSEANYRKGFEAALEPANRGKSYDQALKALHKRYPDISHTREFQVGYARGHRHAANRQSR